jgi:hypothetical protein
MLNVNLNPSTPLSKQLNLKLSKHLFVVYMDGLLAVCPYINCPLYSPARGVSVAVAVATAALTPADLNTLKLASEPYMAYLKHKLGEWYSEAQRPERRQPVVVADEPTPALGS